MGKSPKSSSDKKSKTIEEIYKKQELHQHILHSPDTYIGSAEEKKCHMWIYDDGAAELDPKIILKEIKYVPGFYKICDEILVNAADHNRRCKDCDLIKINIDREEGRISVWNNGDGIPVVEHKDEKIMLPEMLFGNLLTSSNYDKNEKKTVGGKNGYGAKLANIYSTEFIIETLDSNVDLKYYQKFTDNMYTIGKAKITDAKGKKSFTKISFVADFEKFGIKGISKDMYALLKKRCYDLAMTSTAKVYFNDKVISHNNFTKYVDLYFPAESEIKKVIDVTSTKRWKVGVIFDPTDKMEHQNISFVNNICTSRGGTHVENVVNQITAGLKKAVSKKLKGSNIKPATLKENLIFFIDSVIENPSFDTQTKESLTTKVGDFGSKYQVPDKIVKQIIKTGVVDQIITNLQAKEEAKIARADRSKGSVKVEKLYGAHNANSKKGHQCTLILTEGDSAKAFAMSGLNVVGRDNYGVFPLRGKPLNVRDANLEKIRQNKEIASIIKIIGLEHNKEYHDTKGLNYGKIMVLADQDVDGFHIKGLIMNFIHKFWPSLLKNLDKNDEFIESFPTPLLKASKGKGKKKKVIEFTGQRSFDEWKAKNNDGKGWDIKYFKGLATTDAKGAQKCFTDLEDKLVAYFWQSKLDKDKHRQKRNKEKKSESKKESTSSEFIDVETDITSEKYEPLIKDVSEDAFNLAFAKGKKGKGNCKWEDNRKIWVNSYNEDNYIDTDERRVSYYDFIHRQLIEFSVSDNIRSIPNMFDGFKPSQRKAYYGCVDLNLYKKEIKVSELQGIISQKTAYHHGEASLNETIIKMAQNFVGSNNINLLLPKGQFGTRLQGGKDSGAPRYIFTKLNELGKKIFIKEDADVLEYNVEDNKKIEPKFYVPIIPMCLVNGSEGIGTGYSTQIEPCNPRDIVANLRRIISDQKPKSMKPWYKHFTGTIEKIDTNKFVSRAKYDIIDDDTIHITDLPIGTWTDDYKAFIDNLRTQSEELTKVAKKDKKAKATKSGKSPKSKSAKSTKANSKVGKAKEKRKKFLADKSKKSATAKVAKTNPIASSIESSLCSDDCTDVRISFTIGFKPGKLKKHIKEGTLESNLKLAKPISLNNMHMFDENGKIIKYSSYGSILKHFAEIRLALYQKRKDYLLDKWKKEIDILKWKMKFIKSVVNGEIIIFKKGKAKRKDEVLERLVEMKFPQFQVGEEKNPSYNYITSIGLFHLTKEEIEKLQKLLDEKKEEIGILEGKSPSDMWTEELDIFMDAYDEWEKADDEKYNKLLHTKKVSTNKRKSKSKSKK